MNLERVRQMGFEELLSRSRQEAAKWLDRTSPPPRAVWHSRERFSLEHFRATGPGRFFAGAATTWTPDTISQHMPTVRTAILTEAEALLAGRFDLLGYRGLTFGNPIDWHLDPVSGQRAPLVHWSRLNPLDFSQVGDSRVVWELNRHQWMIRLGQAYRLTNDERYAEAATRHLRHWISCNPPGIGINWATSLEVSLRLISWCWCLFLIENARALTPELFAVVLDSIRAHARHVERYLSHYFSPTHLTGEALGLYYAGQIFREWRPAARWSSVGMRILVAECERQILADGVHFEQAMGYQRYTLEIYLQFLILASRSGQQLPAVVMDRTARMIDAVLELRFPDGSLPQIGDSDGGSLVPFERRTSSDFRGVLATAAAVFQRGDCGWAAGGAAADVLWLLGAGAPRRLDPVRAAPPAAPPSGLLPEGGYAVMRSDWRSDGQMLTFDVGRLGGAQKEGHGHADLLSVQCAAFGEPFLIDAGTYCYTGAPLARRFFRGTSAHSTVLVDDQPQSMSAGPFQWSDWPRATLRDWRRTGALMFAEAEHHAYARLADPVVHRRRIVYVRGRYWVIVDDLEGSGEHQVDVRFQFAPLDVQMGKDLTARAKGLNGHSLVLRPFATKRLTGTVHLGEVNPMQGWVSREYGHCEPAPLVSYVVRSLLPLRVVTLVAPIHQAEQEPTVSGIYKGTGEPVGLAFDATGERLIFGDGGLPSLSDHVRHRRHRRG